MMGYGLFSLCVIHKEGLCPSSGDINRLMIMKSYEYLDGPGQRAQRAIVEITQRKGRLKDG
jgi:hypothetical protein